MEKRSSALALLREALRGGQEQDFTEGSLDRAIILLAVPMVMEMAMESLFAIVDVFWVSRLGADAVAAVGLTESMLALVYALAMGISMAATATVARRIGEKRPEDAARAGGQVLLLGVLVSVPLAIAGALFAPQLLALMGATPSVIATGSSYAAVMLAGNATILGLFLINAIFRGAGDALVAMRVLWIANILNIVLGPLFIFGVGPFPKLGVLGAAVATTIGRGIGVLLQLYILFGGGTRVRMRASDLRPDKATLASVSKIAASGTAQAAIDTASWIGLVRILSSFGSAALAGYTIGMRVVVFAILPSWGLSNATATMVGQNLGAGKPERAERSVYRAGLWNTVFLGAVGVVFILFARPILRPFAPDPAVLDHAVSCLRIVSAGFFCFGFGMVFTQTFNGAGDTWTPTLLNLACFWAFEIPFAWVLSRTSLGPIGVYTAIAAAFSALAVVSGLMFRRGGWKARKL